eukprot:TRINITY_DN37726_c0_g1_i2.p1 TRINITY_DN37726_c0_g1~~TRINITY_DN37726_c0_g1_i2.p1  ORF type:complete len:861 (+),score=261.38 TRINITY_DN37726_c0_g1_i2:162-2744(+)
MPDEAGSLDLFPVVQKLLRGRAKLSAVEELLQSGADPSSWSGPNTPVRCAIQVQNKRLLELLLQQGASANALDAKGVSPLHMAVFDGKADCVQLLIDAQANVNIQDRHGQTPLFFAPNRSICEILVEGRADANITNDKGQAPLHLAAHAGLDDAVAWLLTRSDTKVLTTPDANGRTAVEYASHSRSKCTAAVLQQKKGGAARLKDLRELRRMRVKDKAAAVTQAAAAFQKAKALEPVKKELNVEDLRKRAKGELISSMRSGAITAALAESRPDSPAASAQNTSTVKSPKASEEAQEPDVEVLRRRAKGGLTFAMRDGGLSDALGVSRDKAPGEEPSAGAALRMSAAAAAADEASPPVVVPALDIKAGTAVADEIQLPQDRKPVLKNLSHLTLYHQAHQAVINSAASDSSEERQTFREEKDGCRLWTVTLKKTNVQDKYGFVQTNGKMDFETRMSLLNSRQLSPSARSDASKVQPEPEEAEASAPASPEGANTSFNSGPSLCTEQLREEDFHGGGPGPRGPEVLIVRRVHEGGLLERWNKKHPEAEVQPHDRILEVNGETTIAGMQREIRTRRIVLRLIRYPEKFQVSLTKAGKLLGFRLERPAEGAAPEIRISEVLKSGLLSEYNEVQIAEGNWHLVVLADMRIEAVNDVTGDALKMTNELKGADSVLMSVRRAEQATFSQQQVRARLQVLQALRGQQQASRQQQQRDLGATGGSLASQPEEPSASAATDTPAPAESASSPAGQTGSTPQAEEPRAASGAEDKAGTGQGDAKAAVEEEAPPGEAPAAEPPAGDAAEAAPETAAAAVPADAPADSSPPQPAAEPEAPPATAEASPGAEAAEGAADAAAPAESAPAAAEGGD